MFGKHVHMHVKKMGALNKHAILAAILVILRRRRRCRQIKKALKSKKRLWIRPTNLDRQVNGAFYSKFLVAKSLDRRDFFK